MRANVNELAYCCGVHEFGNFGNIWADGYIEFLVKRFKKKTPSFFIATFIDNTICKEAYEKLKKELKLVWQSEPRTNYWNKDSKKNEVFICIYTLK